MRDIIEDSEGLLWVAGLSAALRWREAWAERMAGGITAKAGSNNGETPARRSMSVQARRINIEVIDPRRASVVARIDMEDNEYLVSLLPQRRAALYREDSTGNPRLRIARLALLRR
jgi:hypothetical protein